MHRCECDVPVLSQVVNREQVLLDLRSVDSWDLDLNLLRLRLYVDLSVVRDVYALPRCSLGQCTGVGVHARVGCSGMRRLGPESSINDGLPSLVASLSAIASSNTWRL